MADLEDFNTSYVTVQRFWRFTRSFVFSISIHPMLRFNFILSSSMYLSIIISIHPMLRFNSKRDKTCFTFVGISIHPMLRFNFFDYPDIFIKNWFQYILCYGSTIIILIFMFWLLTISIHPMLRFNFFIKNPSKINKFISIHPMLRFNE